MGKVKYLIVLTVFFLVNNVMKGTVLAQSVAPSPSTCPTPVLGDANGDCQVNETDYQVWLTHYGQTTDNCAIDGNFNCPIDTKVNGIDFAILRMTYTPLLASPLASPSPLSSPPAGGDPTPTPQTGNYILMPRTQLLLLPTSGSTWDYLSNRAHAIWGTTNLCDQDNKVGVDVLAGGLVFARTGETALRTKVRNTIFASLPTLTSNCNNAVLSLGRQLGAYILAADLIQLDDLDRASFSSWLEDKILANLGGHGRWNRLTYTCEDSSNNWGAYACASLVAARIYLGHDVEKSWAIFQGFTGNRAAYSDSNTFAALQDTNGFQGAPSSWSCSGVLWSPTNIDLSCPDYLIGGVSEDAQRSGAYPVISKSYVSESASGLAFQAELLQQQGFPAWERLRIVSNFLSRYSVWNYSSVGYYVPWQYNYRLNIDAPTRAANSPGRIFGYTDWLYGK